MNNNKQKNDEKIHFPDVEFEPPTLGGPGDDGDHYTMMLP